MTDDVIERYIALKQNAKAIEEEYRALETIIFADANLRKDERIKIVPETIEYVLNDEAYSSLESIGIETTITVTETRKKTLKEFDVDIQNALVENPKNYTTKVSRKESIRLK